MSEYAILIGQEVKPCNLMTWARWLQAAGIEGRRVAYDELDGAWVSTVFLGLNHAFLPGAPPQWFETGVCITGDIRHMEVAERYATWAQAEIGHAKYLRETKAYLAMRGSVTLPGAAPPGVSPPAKELLNEEAPHTRPTQAGQGDADIPPPADSTGHAGP